MRALLLLLPLLLALPPAHARGDHPEVPSYPGAEIIAYDFKEFEEAQLMLSKPAYVAGRWQVSKLLPVDGKVTYIRYGVAETVSSLQVFRNYQSSLARSGFKELFVCERPCMDDSFERLREQLKTRDLAIQGHKNTQYLAAQRGNTYVSLFVADYGGGPRASLFVIEKGQMDTGLMAVTGAGPMAQALSAQGKVDVYGFLFDSGKAQLKPGSAASLNELGQLLRDNSQLRIELIGHTDDVGAADANQALSLARAQAVAAALIAEQGIAPDRLQASGKGASQPLSPATDEVARARNRRVEIVAAQAGAQPQATQAQATQGQRPPPARPAATPPTEPKPAEPARASTGSAVDTANKVMDAADKLKRLLGR